MKNLIFAAALAATALTAVLAQTPATPPAVAAPAAAAPRVDVDPAIWVAKDADTTIYLFGTVHMLDGKQDWFNDKVRTAYDASGEVVVEMLPPDPPESAQAKVMALAVDMKGRKLASRLKPETAAKLAKEAAALGVPAAAMDRFEPWFAATMLATMRYQKAGFLPQHGAEAVILTDARKAGKTLGQLETFEWQLGLFDSLSDDLQIALLTGAIEQMAEADAMLGTMMASWAAGDVEKLAVLLNESLRETPALGKLLLADRNAKWAEWVDTRMDKPGTVFMAVGAGHLGGPDSVQKMLAKRGIKTERVKG